MAGKSLAMIIDYYYMQIEAEKKYGEKTVVMMEKGSFFEIYEYNPDNCEKEEDKKDKNGKKWTEKIGKAKEVHDVIKTFKLASADGNKDHSIMNPRMLGFPTISWEKIKQILLEAGYTVVKVEQVGTEGKSKKREITGVYSPTMDIDNANSTKNEIMCIYVEYQNGKGKKYENYTVTVGISAIDIITAETSLTEFYSKKEDEIHAMQEIYRIMWSSKPREIIVYLSDFPQECFEDYKKFIRNALSLDKVKYTKMINMDKKEYKDIEFQIEYLNRVYGKKSSKIKVKNEKIMEDLGIERVNYARLSLILLIEYCNMHDSKIVENLHKPTKNTTESKNLILSHNAAEQLGLLGEGETLLSIINHTRTKMGKRKLERLVANPYNDKDKIESSYKSVESMLTKINNTSVWKKLEFFMRDMSDIDKLHRKMELRTITPKELGDVMKTYCLIAEMFTALYEFDMYNILNNTITDTDISSFNSFMEKYARIIDVEKLQSCSFEKQYYDDATHEKVISFNDYPLCTKDTKHTKEYKKCKKQLKNIVAHFNSLLGDSKSIKLANIAKKTKVSITETAIIGKKNKCQQLKNYDDNLCQELTIKNHTTAESILYSDDIKDLCDSYDTLSVILKKKLYDDYMELLDSMTKFTFFESLSSSVATIDLFHCFAKISEKYSYKKPTIVNSNDGSYLNAENVRHPIIERIIDGKYITNNISIGNGNSTHNGILLFGNNKNGKSSLAKAVALNVIMAQMGCYTACDLTYYPFDKIITRLTKNDDMQKGESTFSVEISELRTILRQSDNRTLVMGDELASGTEIFSSTVITVNTLKWLTQSKSSFIFATHMHNIVSMLKDIDTRLLGIYHLSFKYCEKDDIIIYDRKLTPGSGPFIYGVSVAKYLGLPKKFIDDCNMLINTMTDGNILTTKKSKYNSKHFKGPCELCGKNSDIQTHHVVEQQNFSSNYYDDGSSIIRKNSKQNLLSMCNECHKNLHSEGKMLEILTTPNGYIVDYKKS